MEKSVDLRVDDTPGRYVALKTGDSVNGRLFAWFVAAGLRYVSRLSVRNHYGPVVEARSCGSN